MNVFLVESWKEQIRRNTSGQNVDRYKHNTILRIIVRLAGTVHLYLYVSEMRQHPFIFEND